MEGGEEEEEKREEGEDKKVKKRKKEGKLSYPTPLTPINYLLRINYILLFSLVFNI